MSNNIKKYENQIALCALLSNKNGKQYRFNISNNNFGASSSIFEFGEYAVGDKSLWPDHNLGMINSITLPSVRLHNLLINNDINSKDYDFWVVDLQGAEHLALKGAGPLLLDCKALLVEVSQVEVYKGGVLSFELDSWLIKNGFFPLWEAEGGHDDVLYVRKEILESVENVFKSEHYQKHNKNRLDHLASLGFSFEGSNILEVGAGIGDHTEFYLSYDCSVTVSDARPCLLYTSPSPRDRG